MISNGDHVMIVNNNNSNNIGRNGSYNRRSSVLVRFLPMMQVFVSNLKQKVRKYPSIHTNYIISHSTILQYNHNI